MAADVLTAHPVFRKLESRVRARWLLRFLRRGMVWALAGCAASVVLGRMLGVEWLPVVLGWSLLSLTASLALAMARRPGSWEVARAADGLGLAERTTSSLHARRVGATVANLIEADAERYLGELDPTRYAIDDGRRGWQAVGVGAALLVLLVIVPMPTLGNRQSAAAEHDRLAIVQQRVQAMELQVPRDPNRPSNLSERTAEELRALRDALARTRTSDEAAQALERSQQQLSQLPSRDDYAARRSLENIAAALESQSNPELVPLARALRSRDDQATQQALADLSARLDGQQGPISDLERNSIQLALQAAANAAAPSQPQLAGALRRAASNVGSRQNGALTDPGLTDLLAQDSADASALSALEQAMGDLSQLRATTLPVGATLVPASGTPTAYVLVRGTPPPNATPILLNGGTGTGNLQGPGLQTGNPSSGASPYGSTPYDPVYAPTHLGGEGGPPVQVPGDATDARGQSVDLPNGPVSAGDVRPYDQVYAEYAQEARQSAARQQLPANVQGLVDRYFGAIAPTPGVGTP